VQAIDRGTITKPRTLEALMSGLVGEGAGGGAGGSGSGQTDAEMMAAIDGHLAAVEAFG
jgi:hypothetical protein